MKHNQGPQLSNCGGMTPWHLWILELIHKLGRENVVLDALSHKKEFQNDKLSTKMQTLCAIFIGESNLKHNIKETYLKNAFAHHYFIKLQNKRKVKGITLRKLLKWKQFHIYKKFAHKNHARGA